MPVTKFQFQPGIHRETTEYTEEGRWFDADKVRFRMGVPEKIGGWQKATVADEAFAGRAVAIHTFADNNGAEYICIATNKKLYILSGGAYYDITPIRLTTTLGSDPFETGAVGSGIVTVTHASHGAFMGDYVTFSGATTFDGITTGQINVEHEIVEIIDGDTYTVDTGGSASSGSTSGGGGSVQAVYQINTGVSATVFGTGWGAGTWSRGTWGSSASSAIVSRTLRRWSIDSFGEDLVIGVAYGKIYYWDTSAGLSNNRAVEISTLSGASGTPTFNTRVFVASDSRIVIAVGTNPYGSNDVEPLLIRWSDVEDVADWTPTDENSAGDLFVDSGSQIVSAIKTRSEILVFTDSSLHSLRYVGGDYVFGLVRISGEISVAGYNAAVSVDDFAFWMGARGFYKYDGRAQHMECSVEDYVFNDINFDEIEKVYAGVNSKFEEVIWLYPSADSDENDRYVIYNYKTNIWYYGTIERTTWSDGNVFRYPLATDVDTHTVYYHDFGLDDGSTDPPSAISAYIKSASFDIADGDRFMFVTEYIPDVTFRNSTASSPSVTYTFEVKTEPGASVSKTTASNITRTGTSPETYTKKGYIRMRGRSMTVKIGSSDLGVDWRAGTLRLNLREDGRR